MTVYLPTAEEVLLESLREYGIEPGPDEKRSSYLPVIRRFGGLHATATAVSGQSRTLLTALAGKYLTRPQIDAECNVTKGCLSGQSYIERNAFLFERETDRIKRVSRRRYLEHVKHSEPENLEVRTLLEYWADRSVLSRAWKLDPCPRCRQPDCVPALNIQRRIVCTHCGHRLTLPARVELAYTLHRTVRHAVDQGLIPVVLTGRFLRGLSHRGFLWLPGVKYTRGTQAGDIDILACCDGHLVFCECKTLLETSSDAKTWDKVIDQFIETSKVAVQCGGGVAILAARVNEYPQPVKDKIAAAIEPNVPYLLLDMHDLDRGHRDRNEEGKEHWLTLHDLIREPFPEARRPLVETSRVIQLGFGEFIQQLGSDRPLPPPTS